MEATNVHQVEARAHRASWMSTVPDQWSRTWSRVKHLSDSMNLECTLDWLIALPNSMAVH